MTRPFKFCFVLLIAGVAFAPAWSVASDEDPAGRPARRVVAAYFHRTQRCPTCLKVGDAIERVIRENFAAELRDGRLASKQLDFQDPTNASYVSTFRINGPTFLILLVEDDRVVAWKPAPRTWGLLGDPAALSHYIQAEIRSVLTPTAQVSKTRSE